MIGRNFYMAMALLLMLACSKAELAGNTARSGQGQGNAEALVQEEGGQTTDDNTTVDEPVMTGGTFLTSILNCEAQLGPAGEDGLRDYFCRLEAAGIKVEIPEGGKVILSTLDETRAPLASEVFPELASTDWHWRLRIPDEMVIVSALMQFGDETAEQEFVIESVATTPGFLLYGANTTYLIGDTVINDCSAERQAMGDNTTDVNPPRTNFVIEFEVPPGGAVMDFELKGVCRLQTNTSTARIYQLTANGNEQAAIQPLMPVPDKIANINKPFGESVTLQEGRYIFAVQAGVKPEDANQREDFFIGDVIVKSSVMLPLISDVPILRNSLFEPVIIVNGQPLFR